jgi:beta-phosphoglucomutase
MIRAVIFDFDGVLADTEPLHFAAFRDVLRTEGVAFTEDEYYARYLGYDDLGVFRAVSRDRALAWDAGRLAGLVERKAARLEELERRTSILFPGAEGAVRRLAATFPLAIASGALRDEILRALAHAGLAECFQAVVAGGEAASKPSPEPYLCAVSRLSAAINRPLLPSDCVAIEDSQWGLESAQAAGLRTIAVAHTYPASALSQADLVIPGLDALDLANLGRI